jgi:acyl-CoA thioesterase-1
MNSVAGFSDFRTKNINIQMRFKIILFFVLVIQMSCSDTGDNQNKVSDNLDNQKAKEEETTSTEKKKNIIFFGDSLTAGYGLDEASSDSYPAIIERKIDSLGLSYKVINAGLSGETTAGGNERVNWVMRQPVDVFVLALGGNDGLRGIDPKSSIENLRETVLKVKKKYPEAKIVIAGMEAPPNMGEDYTTEFRSMYPKLAEEYDLTLVPFLLENVGGIPSLNQRDGIHPNVKGHKILAENVWNVLEDIL